MLASAAALVLAGAAPASAGAYDDALSTSWDGPTVHLAWDGGTYDTATASFLGDQVVVPGDVAGRTVTVRNDGPTTATLRGWITDVVLGDAGAPDAGPPAGAGDFYTDLTVAWRSASARGSASLRDLRRAGRTPVVEVPLARGEATRITLLSTFPLEATSGNGARGGPYGARFSVLLELGGVPGTGTDGGASGAAPATGGPGAGATGADVPGSNGRVDAGGVPGAPMAGGIPDGAVTATAPLALTGLDLLRPALVAGAAVGVGGLLLAAVRRRRPPPEPVAAGERAA